HGSQHAATTDGGAGHTAHARARHSASLPAAHIVPGRATYCRYCQNCNCACFSERLKIHELTPYDGWPMSVFRTLPAVQQKPDPILRVHAVPSHVAGQPGVIEFEKCNYGSAAGPCNSLPSEAGMAGMNMTFLPRHDGSYRSVKTARQPPEG